MAKKKLQIETLAKLRQFAQGMDPAVFLSTEWRQVTRALEQAHINIDDPVATVVGTNASTGFFALDTNSYSATQNLTFSTYQILDSVGTVVSGYIFRPTVNGKFWVEANGGWTRNAAAGSGYTATSSIVIRNEAGTALRSAIYEHKVDSGGFIFTMKVNNIVSTIVDLTTTSGVYFSTTIDRAILDTLSFKIYRIGD